MKKPELIILEFPLLDSMEKQHEDDFFTNQCLEALPFKNIAEFVLTYPPYYSHALESFEFQDWVYDQFGYDGEFMYALDSYLKWSFDEVSEYVIRRMRTLGKISRQYRFLRWLDTQSVVLEYVGNRYWTGHPYE